eukprot:2398225-Rhodomonas_salina.2
MSINASFCFNNGRIWDLFAMEGRSSRVSHARSASRPSSSLLQLPQRSLKGHEAEQKVFWVCVLCVCARKLCALRGKDRVHA